MKEIKPSFYAHLFTAATRKLCKPVLVSICALSSVAAFADVCPEATDLKSEKVTSQRDRVSGNFIACSSVAQDIDDNKKAMEKLENVYRKFYDFLALESVAVIYRPHPNGVTVDFTLWKKELIVILLEFGKGQDAGTLFTFGTGAEGEEKANAMAYNLGWDPMKSVVKNVDGTYSVMVELTALHGFLDTMNSTEERQNKNGGYLRRDYELREMDMQNDINKKRFDATISKAFQFLDRP